MQLSREEEDALDGKHGEAMATAYRILLAIGNAMDADRLVPVRWAHISGVNYNTIGDAGLAFLEEMSRDAEANNTRVRVMSTLNPMGYDPVKGYHDERFVERQERIRRAYERMGVVVVGSYTCIPYEVFPIPARGEHVCFAESNAAIYANSILGLVTNKESALSALASALTGKAPYSGLRIEEARRPSTMVDVKHEVKDELDAALLGYFAGRIGEQCISFRLRSSSYLGRDGTARINAKALCSALGTSGSAGMFMVYDALHLDQARNRVEYTEMDARMVREELSDEEGGDVIVFGSPQLGLYELSMLAEMIGGRRFRKRCMVFCARRVYEEARRIGYIDAIEHAGGEVYSDCCSCLTPLISRNDVDSVITNSVKAAYYLRNWNRVGVCLKSMREIVRDECI
ncbi:MAG: aconitase X catalytic domain-containing protein [Candidatus Nitrosocaldus sp.]|nr:aconitase X catalytic domain-containing protein [Candidatus Nitrosocaldus sp.]MDW8274862.1 aconitase X catalytic domain-containing protein [Candidatus Nitrosocaldus sp.]